MGIAWGCGCLVEARYRYASIAPTVGWDSGERVAFVGALLARRSEPWRRLVVGCLCYPTGIVVFC